MDFANNDIDTFSVAFTADQFSIPDDLLASPLASKPDSTSPQSQTDSQNAAKSPTQQNGSQTNGSSGPKLNPRSCVTCRRRKVRCDKQEPCTNCQKAGIDCIFPSPGRAPRKSKKPPDAELLSRLKRLEGVVQKLGKNGNGEEVTAADLARRSSKTETTNGMTNGTNGTNGTKKPTDSSKGVTESSSPGCPFEASSPGEKLDRIQQYQEIRGRESGRMVIGEGRSRYVSNSFWAGLTEEIAEMRDLLNYSSSDEELDDGATPSSTDTTTNGNRLTHQEFIFGYSSTMTDLRVLHPPADQVMTYWDLYTSNVDPVVRILHKSTTKKLFQQAAKHLSSIPKSNEPLIFAVYLAVVTSMREDECQALLKIDRNTATKKYRFATEQAFAKSNFLATQELVVVAAFTLFLTCIRRLADGSEVWTLTGLLLRMAHSLGLHRDGTHFGLSPYDTEIRRRLWWQVCTLDVRASEDQGSEPMTGDKFFDTKLPLNINDEDIWPGMKEQPIEHEGATEMTFDLVRYEIGGTIRLLSSLNKCPKESRASEHDQLEAREAALERLRLKLEDRYLRHCDMSIPLQWVAANVSRLVMAKIWLVIHHPFRRGAFGAKIASETRDRTFLTSIDVIRYARLLETQQKTMKWGWLFKSYFQWHALAFLLAELSVRTKGPAVEDAWKVVDEAWPAWDASSSSKKLILWKPIVRLLHKARAVRKAEQDRQKTFPMDGTLGPSPIKASHDIATVIQPTLQLDLNGNTNDIKNDNAPFFPLPANGTIDVPTIDSVDDYIAQSTFIPIKDGLMDPNDFPLNASGYNNALLDNMAFPNDGHLDNNIDWAAWDAEMGMDFSNEFTQPMDLDMEQLWGGAH